MTYRFAIAVAMNVAVCVGMAAAPLRADETAPMPAVDFDKLHELIKRHPMESRWMEIDWHPSVSEGRKIAAAEGKPLFLWAGSGGAPAAGC